MQKTLVVKLIIILFILTPISFAGEKKSKAGSEISKDNTEAIEGKIVSINYSKKEIIVKDDNNGIRKSIIVNDFVISYLTEGKQVKVLFNSKDNTIENIKFDKSRRAEKGKGRGAHVDQAIPNPRDITLK